MRIIDSLKIAALAVSIYSVHAEPSHGVSVYGIQNIKLKKEDPFPYVNPSAPKGGTLHLGYPAAFSKLNPYSLKGISAPGTDLVFETACIGSAAENEPGTAYGHIVETIDIADDHLSMTYKIRDEAAFSDGKPITSADFVFSFNLMKNDPEYHPQYKQYFADIKNCVAVDTKTVRFDYAQYNQELPLITGDLPILPEHIYGAEGKVFGKDFDLVAVGSGPYIVETYEFQKFITYKRNPDWWAKDLPKSRGTNNFDRITYNCYLDSTPMKEAIKGGDTDVEMVMISKDWATDYHGPFVQKNYLLRWEVPHSRPQGMQGSAFNLRKEKFQSLKTRYALALVFNFDWYNKNLFYGQYQRCNNYFANSPDLTDTKPPEGRIKEMLLDLRGRFGSEHVPKAALYKELKAPGEGVAPDIALKQAELLLGSVGWELNEDGYRYRDGEKFTIKYLIRDQSWNRIIEPYSRRLQQLGIDVEIDLVQTAEYKERLMNYNFDMVTVVYGHSPSPGNEMLNYWSSEAADTPLSSNIPGIKNPAVDELLSKAVKAKTREELAFHIKALDKILTHNVYLVPNWGLTFDRALVWNKFSAPEKHCTMRYIDSVIRDFWWFNDEKAATLEKARAEGKSLPPVSWEERH